MLWFLVWSVLVVGTLVGAFFLFRWLWRRFVDMSRRVGASAQKLGASLEAFSEHDESAPLRPVSLDMTPDELAEVLAVREHNLGERALRKDFRRETTFARWRAIAGTRDGKLTLAEQKRGEMSE